jgi:hypothetical protein
MEHEFAAMLKPFEVCFRPIQFVTGLSDGEIIGKRNGAQLGSS